LAKGEDIETILFSNFLKADEHGKEITGGPQKEPKLWGSKLSPTTYN
jgi:hypothetical protein